METVPIIPSPPSPYCERSEDCGRDCCVAGDPGPAVCKSCRNTYCDSDNDCGADLCCWSSGLCNDCTI